MENNNPKEGKIFKLSLVQAILIFSLGAIVTVMGINLYAYCKGEPNLYSSINELFEKEEKNITKENIEKVELTENKESQSEKSYITYFMDNSNDSPEKVNVYEDNTATVQVEESSILAFDKELEAKIEANVEYQITGINSKIVGVDFLNCIEGGAYIGSCIFIYGEDNRLYMLDMQKGISTGKFETTEIMGIELALHREKPSMEDFAFGDRQLIVMVIHDINGIPYVISRDGTVEKYIKPEENNQQQTVQNATDTQAKEVIQKYLSIWGTFEGEPLEMLKTEMPQYITENIDYEDTIVENGISYVNTNAIYDALEFEMKKYMSYEMFNEYFLSYKDDINPFKNVNGKLYVAQLGASGAYYEVTEIERMNRNGDIYGYNVYVNTIYGDTTKQETYYFELQSIEGTMFVISIGVG